MSFKGNFKKKLCTLALIASFVMSIATPAVASNVPEPKGTGRATIDDIRDASYLGDENTTYTVTGGSDDGGAIFIDAGGTINGTILPSFVGNSVTKTTDTDDGVLGGAIYNSGVVDTISSRFTSNFAELVAQSTVASGDVSLNTNAYGGAIYNNSDTFGSIYGSNFTGNYASVKAEAISGGGGSECTVTVNTSVYGGAICNSGTINDITNTTFTNNSVIAKGKATLASTSGRVYATAKVLGGAIYNDGTISNITNTHFIGNSAQAECLVEGGAKTRSSFNFWGGAIFNCGTISNITNATFRNNSAGLGGAIYNGGSGIGNIANTIFRNNSAGSGGAIHNTSFIGDGTTTGIIDTDFTYNRAEKTEDGTAQGGAIYTSLALLIKAESKDVTFRGNYVKAPDMTKAQGSAIYVASYQDTLSLNAAQSRKIIFEDDQTIEGQIYDKSGKYYGYNVNVEGGGTVEFSQKNTPTFKEGSGIYGAGHVTVSGGTTLVISNLSAMALTLNDGTIDFTGDAKAKAYYFVRGMYDGSTTTTSINLKGVGGCLKLDVDLSKGEMDSINVKDSGTATIDPTAKLHITSLALLKDSAQDETPVPFTSNLDLASATQYDGAEELTSHANKYKVRYDSSTGKFIFTKSGVSDTTIATGDGVNVMNFVWLETVNNLQKRLGDLRGGEESDMAWVRFQRSNDDYDGARKFNVSGNLYQVGYDFALKNQVASRGYFGVSLEAFDGTQSYQIGGGDVKSMSLGAYYTKIYDSGHYFDFILRYGRLENDSTSYDATAGLSGILTKLDYAMNSVTLSGEYGYRWNMGNAGLYLEPQAEFIYGYLSGAKATSSTNILADIDSTNHFVTRLGLAFGQRVKNFNYYLRGSYYHDFAGTIHVKYGTTPYQQDSAQNWWEVSLGGGWNISKVSYFYAELTKHFKDVSNSLNFNVGFRFTL